MKFLVFFIVLYSNIIAGNVALKGIFAQIWLDDLGAYSQQEFDTLIMKLKDDGLETFYIQYASYNEYSWYPSSQSHFTSQTDVIGKIVESCTTYNMNYVLGLNFDADWESSINDTILLTSLKEKSITTAEELYNLYGNSENFKGYYIPYEIDDVVMLRDENYEDFTNYYLKGLTEALEKTSDYIAVAPYFSDSDLDEFDTMWNYILGNSFITEVMPQNGAGTHRVSNEIDTPIYFREFKRLSHEHNRSFSAAIELFDQIHGYPIDSEAFEAIPITFEEFEAVIDTVDNYTENLIGFSLSYYLSEGENFREKYNHYYESVDIVEGEVIDDFELSVYPNPFNPVTTISITIVEENSSVTIYDVKGRIIRTVKYKQKGNYLIEFNGSKLTSGVYFVKAMSGMNVSTKKMILIK